MRIIDSYRIAKANLFRSRARSFLTIFGVVVGVSAIVLLVSLGIGLQRLTVEKIASSDLLTTINVSAKKDSGRILNDAAVSKFKEIKNVTAVAPSVKSVATATYNQVTTSTLVYGIESNYFGIEGINIDVGNNQFNGEKEVVISRALAKTLGVEDPSSMVNQKIELKFIIIDEDKPEEAKEINETFNIIAIDKGETVGVAYAPLSFLKKNLNEEKFDAVKVKVNNRKNVVEVKKKIEELNYNVSTMSDLISQIETVFLVLEIILGIIGGIGLFVASIGIINTMTIALLERTHEIGIMKAVGASNNDIRKIFLSEAVLISFLGGLLGLISAILIGIL
ncbi:MAG: ABC transporter permease, partial [Candidatus Berkelbacteria bacterium]|nr:ABC transporter permease [Candidatus Berkelbacteria bacterium]